MSDEHSANSPQVAIAFRVAGDVMEEAKRAASEEGLSLASVARRALLRDLRQRNGTAFAAHEAA